MNARLVSAAAVSGFAGVVALNAGNRAEVLVDRAKVVIREMAEIGPRHDL